MKNLLVCVLLASSLLAASQPIEFNYICPVPDSRYINPEQVIILKTGYCFDSFSLHHAFALIQGTESGSIGANLSLSTDLRTLFIRPFSKFTLGEKVHVYISSGLKTIEGKNIGSTGFDFYIRATGIIRPPGSASGEQDAGAGEDLKAEAGPARTIRDNNLPPDYPAPVSVYTGPGVEDGYIFFTPTVRLTPQFDRYLTIWDNYGTPIFYKKVDKTVTDFKVLGDGILSYAVNALQYPENNCFYLMDGNYTLFDSIKAGNGYDIDNHDILLLENGHFLILIYDQQTVNMSLIVPGGMQNAQVTGLVIQEVDNNRNVYFQWRSWDHFQITDATWDIDLTAYFIDYVHANAVDLDSDGNILVSCRHMDEVTKIDFNTGAIVWRWGINAVNNDFTFMNDPAGFSHQHDIRKLGNGNYTVFDNGNLHVPPFTRASEYHLNEATMQATLVWSYQHDPLIYSPLTGGNQRLPNNNRLIGWGGTASPIAITEVNQNNQVVMEIIIPDSVTGYRARKYPWETTMFSTQDAVSFGNYDGSAGPKEYLLQITNDYSQSIQINSYHNLSQGNFFVTGLPLTITPGSSLQVQVFFQPDQEGTYEDILTLNYDNAGNTRRIARQVVLSGLWEPDLPVLQFDPANGAVDVDPGTEITVTFSEPVSKIFGIPLSDDDVPNLFYFREDNLFGNDVGFHGTVSTDKKVITIIPDDTLKEEQLYFIQLLPNKLQDSDGNVITYSDYTYFTTGTGVGTFEAKDPGGISIYPNPARDLITLESESGIIQEVQIYSSDRRLVYSGVFSDTQVQIFTMKMLPGVITFVITTSDDTRHVRRVILLGE